jgi:mannitol-specific phosphotransferase system IIBC component
LFILVDIAGIVVGIVILMLVVGSIIVSVLLLKKRRKRQQRTSISASQTQKQRNSANSSGLDQIPRTLKSHFLYLDPDLNKRSDIMF